MYMIQMPTYGHKRIDISSLQSDILVDQDKWFTWKERRKQFYD